MGKFTYLFDVKKYLVNEIEENQKLINETEKIINQAKKIYEIDN